MAKNSTLLTEPVVFAETVMFDDGSNTAFDIGLVMLMVAVPLTKILIGSEEFILPLVAVATATKLCGPAFALHDNWY